MSEVINRVNALMDDDNAKREIARLQARVAELEGAITTACDKADMPIGNEHRTYSLEDRLTALVTSKLFLARRYEETLHERDDYRRQLEKAEAQKADRWIPVGERLPTVDDGEVLVWLPEYGLAVGILQKGRGWVVKFDGSVKDVAAWRPLPAAPGKEATC